MRQCVEFYIAQGVPKERIFYFTPYPPTGMMKAYVFCKGLNLMRIYGEMLEHAKKACAELGITCITLDHFGADERAAGTTNIPEPTPKGALDLAILI